MTIVAFTALHYGKAWYEAAIRSVIDSVDRYYVMYTDVGSHGHRTDMPCPDTRDELYAIASRAAGDKLSWHEGRFSFEGQQRETIFDLAPDADAIVVFDSDEIYPTGLVNDLITQTSAMHRQRIRVPFVHFWRSMYRAILHDPAYPERIIYPHIRENNAETAHTRPIAHLGYAIPADLMAYKWQIHGHKNELRRDVDWFNEVYLNTERRTDLHPVGSDQWNWEAVNPLDFMPSYMTEHPFYGLDIIP